MAKLSHCPIPSGQNETVSAGLLLAKFRLLLHCSNFRCSKKITRPVNVLVSTLKECEIRIFGCQKY